MCDDNSTRERSHPALALQTGLRVGERSSALLEPLLGSVCCVCRLLALSPFCRLPSWSEIRGPLKDSADPARLIFPASLFFGTQQLVNLDPASPHLPGRSNSEALLLLVVMVLGVAVSL